MVASLPANFRKTWGGLGSRPDMDAPCLALDSQRSEEMLDSCNGKDARNIYKH